MKRLMMIGVDLVFMDFEKDIPDDDHNKYMFELYDLVDKTVFNKRDGAANTFINHPELGKVRVGMIFPKTKVEENGEVFSEIPYGIFGSGVALKDKDGYIKTFAVIQESGLFAGAPPAELRITEIIPDEQFGKQWVAKLNRNTDLPFYLTSIRIKVEGSSVKYTDGDLLKEGIKLLDERSLSKSSD